MPQTQLLVGATVSSQTLVSLVHSKTPVCAVCIWPSGTVWNRLEQRDPRFVVVTLCVSEKVKSISRSKFNGAIGLGMPTITGLTLSPPIPLRFYTLPYWSNPCTIFNFWHSGTLALRTERQSARMSKIKNSGCMSLDPSNSNDLDQQLALKGLS